MVELTYGEDGAMQVTPQPEEGEFGILSQSAVVLHALNSSKWVSVLLGHWNMLSNPLIACLIADYAVKLHFLHTQ